MKHFLWLFCIVFYSLFSYSFATEPMYDSPIDSIMVASGEESKIQTSGEWKHKEKSESEEGSNVDTSITEKNYPVEAPTIIILVLFGILFITFLILLLLKI